MTEKMRPNLSGVSETLLMTLYTRANESQRAGGLIRDDKAVEMVNRMDYDFSRVRLQGHDEVSVIVRMREIDRQVCEFLTRHPDGIVVHIGCGLDTRFDRVDNGRCQWVDLDLPEVIELRQQLTATQVPRYHLLSGSVLEDAWIETVSQMGKPAHMFIAEGVFPYFEETQVKTLFLKLRDQFPGAELVCDAHTPFVVWADNLQLAMTPVKARIQWGLKHAKDVEGWGTGITLLGEWYYFDHPEPRLGPVRWLRFFPPLAKSAGIFHYRLGAKPKD